MVRRRLRLKSLEGEEGSLTGYNPQLFKELPSSYLVPLSTQTEKKLASESLYADWWRFLRVCPDYPPNPELSADPVRKCVFEDFGDLGESFVEWWQARGRELFMENGNLPLVRTVARDERADVREHEIAVILPLKVSSELLLQQVELLLKAVHPGHGLERHQFSTARRRLHPMKRYRTSRFLNMIDIIKAQRSGEFSNLYQIGEEFGIGAKENMPQMNDGPLVMREKRERMSNAVRSLLEKGLTIAHNAALGVFPFDDYKLTSAQAQERTNLPPTT